MSTWVVLATLAVVTGSQECPKPKVVPSVHFEIDQQTKLRVQKNFNRLTIWSVVPSQGPTPLTFASVLTLDNSKGLEKVDLKNYTFEVSLNLSNPLQAGWYATCGSYEYVFESMRATCTYCSLLKLCRERNRHTGTLRTCEEEVVQLLPSIDTSSTNAVLTFAVGEIPLIDAKITLKIIQKNTCVQEGKVMLAQEYTAYPHTFFIVNVTGTELGKTYEVIYQPVGHVRIGQTQGRVYFNPSITAFRIPSAIPSCTLDEETLADKVYPLKPRKHEIRQKELDTQSSDTVIANLL